jgi:hypothetical protein
MNTNLAICDIVTTTNQVAIGHISSQRSTATITPLKLKNKDLKFRNKMRLKEQYYAKSMNAKEVPCKNQQQCNWPTDRQMLCDTC